MRGAYAVFIDSGFFVVEAGEGRSGGSAKCGESLDRAASGGVCQMWGVSGPGGLRGGLEPHFGDAEHKTSRARPAVAYLTVGGFQSMKPLPLPPPIHDYLFVHSSQMYAFWGNRQPHAGGTGSQAQMPGHMWGNRRPHAWLNVGDQAKLFRIRHTITHNHG